MYKISIKELKAWKKALLDNLNVDPITPEQDKALKDGLKAVSDINKYLFLKK